MARYIDADALWKQMFSYYGCINENTAKENYRGVTLMDYEVANLIEDCIDNAPTADVVPKSEVEHWKEEAENQSTLWKQHFESIYETSKETLIRQAKQDVAREIFEEIEDILNNIGYFDEIDFKALKKKYTESEN